MPLWPQPIYYNMNKEVEDEPKSVDGGDGSVCAGTGSSVAELSLNRNPKTEPEPEPEPEPVVKPVIENRWKETG